MRASILLGVAIPFVTLFTTLSNFRKLKYLRRNQPQPILTPSKKDPSSFFRDGLHHTQNNEELLRIAGSDSEQTTQKNSGKPYITDHHLVSCPRAIDSSKKNGELYDNGLLYHRTRTNPPFLMNLHPLNTDQVVSKLIVQDGCFECEILEQVMETLRQSPKNTFFLDIGANIGQWSLYAASMGYDSYAFEPFQANWMRLCNSIAANEGFSNHVHLFNVALSSNEKKQMMRLGVPFKKNPSAVFIRKAKKRKAPPSESISTADTGTLTEEVKPWGREGFQYAWAVTLDSLRDVLPADDRPAILKVDVEGAECDAMIGGLRFLRMLDIIEVVVELSMKRIEACRDIQQIYDLFEHHNSLAPYLFTRNNTWIPLNTQNRSSWLPLSGSKTELYNVIWTKKKL